jgi:hypothetical protein
VLRVGVVGPLGAVSPSTPGGTASYAADLVFQTFFHLAGGETESRFVKRSPLGRGPWRLEPVRGVKFSDGSEVEPEDLARSLRSRGFVVTVVSGHLEVLAPPGSGGAAALYYASIYKDTAQGPIGTGPFILVEQGPERVRLRRAQPQPRRIDEVELVAFESSRQAFVALLRGDIQAVFPLDSAQVELLEAVPNLLVVRSVGPLAVAAQLMPRRLSRAERLGLARSLPRREMADATKTCFTNTAEHPQSVPSGRRLKIGYPRILHELARPALALRRALGQRGGEVVPVAADGGTADPADLDILLTSLLTRPEEMLTLALRSDGAWNYSGYSNPQYDAAVDRGDARAATQALEDDPFLIVICQRERMGAIDRRVSATSWGEWGAFDPLPDWEVAP